MISVVVIPAPSIRTMLRSSFRCSRCAYHAATDATDDAGEPTDSGEYCCRSGARRIVGRRWSDGRLLDGGKMSVVMNRRRFSVAEYYCMGQAGIIGPDERTELIE